MIKEEDINKIKSYLVESENPMFFFDDDPDGLASYLLFRKFLDKGKGVIIKASPVLDIGYLRKIDEYKPDKIFVLDKPFISQEFIDKVNVQIIWIDHHAPVKREGVKYYNPRIEDKNDIRPVTYWCYKVTKKDLWVAVVGCIADWYMPDFIKDFLKDYPDLLDKEIKDPGDALFKTRIGELAKIFSFLLKGKTSDVNKNLAILTRIENPYEILDQNTPQGKFLFRYYEKINKRYQELLKEALETKSDKILLFTYPSFKYSFSNDLANELMYKLKDKLIIVAREKNGEMKVSLRSNVHLLPPIVEKALKDVEGYGGGHEHACGGNIAKKDFNKFVDAIRKEIE